MIIVAHAPATSRHALRVSSPAFELCAAVLSLLVAAREPVARVLRRLATVSMTLGLLTLAVLVGIGASAPVLLGTAGAALGIIVVAAIVAPRED